MFTFVVFAIIRTDRNWFVDYPKLRTNCPKLAIWPLAKGSGLESFHLANAKYYQWFRSVADDIFDRRRTVRTWCFDRWRDRANEQMKLSTTIKYRQLSDITAITLRFTSPCTLFSPNARKIQHIHLSSHSRITIFVSEKFRTKQSIIWQMYREALLNS